MEPVLAPFEALVRQTRLATPRIPVISNVTGGPAAAELAEAEYWRRHLRQPVRFAEGMATLDRMGYSIFVEIGPKPVLLATGRRCLDGDGRAWLPSLRPGRGDWEQTLGSLAELYVRGVAVDWAGCEPAEACRRVALPTYPFQRQRYWFQPVEQPAQPLVYRATPAESRTNGGAAIPAAPAPAGHPRPDLTTPYIAPASEAEQQLARIWEEVIGMAPVGLDDNFFELGGDSLLASLLVTRLRKMFGNDLPVSSLLLDAPTVRELAARLAGQAWQPLPAAEDEGPALPILVPAPEERFQPFHLTDIQQAYVVGRDEHFDLGGVACHSYTEHEGTRVDLDRLNAAWQHLIERHDMLRAVVLPDGRQQVLEHVPLYQIEVLDLRGRSPADVAAELAAIRERMSHQVHDPQHWPMFELRATRLDGDRCRRHFSLDAMITDGYSFRILAKELAQLYQEPETSLEPLPLSFRDYVLPARHLAKPTPSGARCLTGKRVKKPRWSAPELPVVADRPAMIRPRFTRRRGTLAPEHWAELKRLAKQANLTASGAVLQLTPRW